jgi:hypothetical protein
MAEDKGPTAEQDDGGGPTGIDAIEADETVTALAPSPEDNAKARAELEPLLETAGIELVVFVDNEFEVSAGELISALRDIPADRRSHVPHLDDINFNIPEADEDVWIDEATQRFESLTPWQRAITGADAQARSGHEDMREQPNAGAIGPLIPAEKTELLSPVEWDARKAQILGDASTRGTLILLDRHFEEGDEAGPRLLQEVFAHENAEFVRAGIVTNTVTRGEEVKLWKDLADRFDLQSDRLVVISKENMANGCLSFPQSLKVALLTPQFDALLTDVAKALASAHQEAIDELKTMSPYAFERLVFVYSHKEGVWEPETLLRLATISTRDRALTALRRDMNIHGSVREARRIASLKTTETSETTDQAAAIANRLQHCEVFEDGSYVNGVHLPLELGDVFKKRTGATTFVLAAQPCDLMVRAGGKRAREPEFLTLVRLGSTRPEANPQDWHEVPFYFENGVSAYVLLNRFHLVPREALDLCVYNESGSVEIDVDGVAPDRVTPHWDARFEAQRVWAADCVERILRVDDDATRSLVTRAVFRCSKESLTSGELTGNNKVVRFNLVRIGRIRQPANLELFGAFLSHQGRAAFEGKLHD